MQKKYNALSDTIIGLAIFLKYGGDSMSATHDELWASPAYNQTICPEDKETLEAAGWHFDMETDFWRKFT